MDSLLVKVVVQSLYTVLTLFGRGVHTSPTSVKLILEFNSKCDQRGYLAGATEQPLLKIYFKPISLRIARAVFFRLKQSPTL